MPIKRRQAKMKDHRITPAAVEAWKLCQAIIATDLEDSDEYREASHNLDRELGIRPYETSPLNVDAEEHPWWPPNGPSAQDKERWAEAWRLRGELVKASKK